MEKKPLIFITNDDGINAPGIHLLIDLVADMGRVVAVAPDGPNSGQSSAITVNKALRITRHDPYNSAMMYSVSGTPVDCVKLGLHAVVHETPALILSGINHGANSGNSVIYSGTMGAVLEGCMLGIPSVGYSFLSHDEAADMNACRDIVRAITPKILAAGLPHDICLNVNIPKVHETAGMKVTRAARGYWTEEYADYSDPHGRPFYWLTGSFHNEEPDNHETDLYWLDRGYATVVPTRPDQTAADGLKGIAGMLGL